jgi:hypothetical protein
MAHSVTITAPIPTLEEFGKDLGLSKKEQKSLLRIVNRTTKPSVTSQRKSVVARTQKSKSAALKSAR